MSSFKIEEGSSPERLVIREGAIRTEDEVAQKLSEDMGFDLEGAYKTGYTPRHVIEYLITEPHEFDVTFYNKRFYEGRMTVMRVIVRLSSTCAPVWSPIVAITIALRRIAPCVVDIHGVVNRNARTTVVVAIIVVAVVRVAPITCMTHMQVICRPANSECSRYAPEISGIERVS